MSKHEFFRDMPNASPFVKPWIIVTKNGIVAERFPWNQASAALDCARQMALERDLTVNVYEVDAQIIPSPNIGDAIDSVMSGWRWCGKVHTATLT